MSNADKIHQWQNIKRVFNECLDLPSSERESFLENINEGIRNEVIGLLRSSEDANEFIEESAAMGLGFAQDPIIGSEIDDYRIIESIGAGGMGTVYLAERIGFKQKVAIKLIKRGMDTNAVLRHFTLERQILSSLSHPNISQLLDGGSTKDGLPYFVMEYIEGSPISRYCAENELDIRKRLELFQAVCKAISYAHQNLVVHRDIKPSNILVTKEGIPKLLDFGIAKLLDSESNSTWTIGRIFTPEYASPEQLANEAIATTSDVYSLGIVLYELLTGSRPPSPKPSGNYRSFESKPQELPARPSSIKSHEAKTDSKPIKTSLNAKLLKGDLDNILLKAIRIERERRYQSVQEFSQDIDRHLKGLPVLATADSFGYRISKFYQRHRKATISTIIVALSILSISGVAIWQGLIAIKERDKANARFLKLRETAKSLMYETRDSLDSVPGTIELRRQLSEKSVDLLDSVYDETITDSVFLTELADSYEKLARTQLWEFRDFAGAKRACEKAIEIRRKVVNFHVSTINGQLALANSLSTFAEILYQQKDQALLSKINIELEPLLREISKTENSIANQSNLAQYLMGFVGTFKEFETITEDSVRLNEAAAIFGRILENPSSKFDTNEKKVEYVWNLICRGLVYRKLKSDELALADFKKAAEVAETIYTANSSLQLAFNFANFSHRNIGEVYENQNDLNSAASVYEHSIEWLSLRENNAAQSKPNLAWRLGNSAGRYASILHKQGKSSEARTLISKYWNNYSQFLNEETNAASLVYSEEPLRYVTAYFAEAGNAKQAVEIWNNHSNRLQRFLDKDPNDSAFLSSKANARLKIAELQKQFGETQ